MRFYGRNDVTSYATSYATSYVTSCVTSNVRSMSVVMSAVAVIVAVMAVIVAVMTVSVYQQHIKSMQNAQKTAARCILSKIKDSFSVNCYFQDSI